jgi:hypothetical protein
VMLEKSWGSSSVLAMFARRRDRVRVLRSILELRTPFSVDINGICR